jgi:hypothetical protein
MAQQEAAYFVERSLPQYVPLRHHKLHRPKDAIGGELGYAVEIVIYGETIDWRAAQGIEDLPAVEQENDGVCILNGRLYVDGLIPARIGQIPTRKIGVMKTE